MGPGVGVVRKDRSSLGQELRLYPGVDFQICIMTYYSVEVRFQDLDAFGHVNNAIFLTYCEQARVRYYDSLFPLKSALDFPFLIVHAELDYKKPVVITDEIEMGIGVGRIGKASWDFIYEARNRISQDVHCTARTVQAYWDHEKKSTAPIHTDLRHKLEAAQQPGA
ncbi:MAG: acyl-CoA thioesterase [Leptospiraceae bacterium]|nr:acyl-CoA thioesterase [Leptospiraceae bacterium]